MLQISQKCSYSVVSTSELPLTMIACLVDWLIDWGLTALSAEIGYDVPPSSEKWPLNSNVSNLVTVIWYVQSLLHCLPIFYVLWCDLNGQRVKFVTFCIW